MSREKLQILHPDRAMRQAKMAAMNTLLRLIRRGTDELPEINERLRNESEARDFQNQMCALVQFQRILGFQIAELIVGVLAVVDVTLISTWTGIMKQRRSRFHSPKR